MTILKARTLIVLATLAISACGSDTLSEAQSEVAGFCITFLSLSDSPEHNMLVSQINKHVGERYVKSGLEAGVARAVQAMGGEDAAPSKPTDLQIRQCQDVLSW